MAELVQVLALIREGSCVADVVIFPDGATILHWRTSPAGTEIYPTEGGMRLVRERSGRSRLKFIWQGKE